MLVLLTKQVCESLKRLGFNYFMIPELTTRAGEDPCFERVVVPLKNKEIKQPGSSGHASIIKINSSVVSKMIKGNEEAYFVNDDDLE